MFWGRGGSVLPADWVDSGLSEEASESERVTGVLCVSWHACLEELAARRLDRRLPGAAEVNVVVLEAFLANLGALAPLALAMDEEGLKNNEDCWARVRFLC